MRIITLGFSFVMLLAACGTSKQAEPTAAPTSPQPSPPPGSPSATLTPEECTQKAGQVRGDIGDGKVACAAGERELGRVKTGIEGGVCCAPESGQP